MPTQSQPTASPKHTPTPAHIVAQIMNLLESEYDADLTSLGAMAADEIASKIPTLNSHPALVAENKRLTQALEEALEWTRGDKQAAELGDMRTELDAETLQARVLALRAALAKEDV